MRILPQNSLPLFIFSKPATHPTTHLFFAHHRQRQHHRSPPSSTTPPLHAVVVNTTTTTTTLLHLLLSLSLYFPIPFLLFLLTKPKPKQISPISFLCSISPKHHLKNLHLHFVFSSINQPSPILLLLLQLNKSSSPLPFIISKTHSQIHHHQPKSPSKTKQHPVHKTPTPPSAIQPHHQLVFFSVGPFLSTVSLPIFHSFLPREHHHRNTRTTSSLPSQKKKKNKMMTKHRHCHLRNHYQSCEKADRSDLNFLHFWEGQRHVEGETFPKLGTVHLYGFKGQHGELRFFELLLKK